MPVGSATADSGTDHPTNNEFLSVSAASAVSVESRQGRRNTELSAQLELSRNQVQFWRDRWQQSSALLLATEQNLNDGGSRQRIELLLSDDSRPGTGAKFSVEQIVQIVAVACELPASSGRPSSHWSPGELAEEAVKRGIVELISPRTVGRF